MAPKLSATALAIALALSGCALVPQVNPRLEEARAAHERIQRSPEVARLAPAEAARAAEAFERAQEAWGSLQDPALVDHLAYVARQRAAIASEAALAAATLRRLDSARARPIAATN